VIGFSLNWIFQNFRKFAKKIQVTLQYEKKNNGYFTCRCIYIYGKWWEMFQTKFLEKIQQTSGQPLLPKSCLLRKTEE
jgi:hypothetical protein